MEVLLWFAAGFPNEKISKQTLLVYSVALADCDNEELQQAAIRLLRTRNKFPTAAEILQEVEEIRGSKHGA